MDKLEAFLKYVDHHVMHHWGSWSFLGVWHFDAVMMGLLTLILCTIAIVNRKKISQVPHGFAMALELYVKFIRDEMVYPNFGGAAHGRKFVPFFCSIFLFIMVANLLGLFPLFSTVTGNVNVTAAIALIFFFTALFATARAGGVIAFKHAFLPAGLPLAMRPFIFFMEIVSFCTRTFALAMRLFANMLGGHIVLYAMVGMTAIFGMIATPSILIALALYFFETFVACLQAYVFTMLAAIFMGMMVHPQH